MIIKTVLVVGGAGYFGRHLSAVLKSQEHLSIYITGRKEVYHPNYYQVNFSDVESFKKLSLLEFDLVIILAASIDGLDSCDLSNPVLQVNTIQLGLFLQFLADECKVKRIIYASSMTVYHPSTKIPVQESCELQPPNVYGLSKMLAENILKFYSQVGNCSILILRLPGIYGGSRKAGFMFNSVNKSLKSEEIIIDQELAFWETIHIDDLCRAVCDILGRYEWEDQFCVMNIGYGINMNLFDIAKKITALTKSNSKVRLGNGVSKGNSFCLDNSQIQKYLSSDLSFEETLLRYIEKARYELRNW